MSELDDPAALEKADPSDFLGDVERFPEQLAEGLEIGRSLKGLPSIEGLGSVAVLGMGGSGISGDVLASVLRDRSQTFVGTVKGYRLPAWVGPDTLVFACSYSGNTEETLEAFEAAQKVGARLVAITTGGTLGEAAEASGIPHARIPAGLQPRAALGYLVAPMLVAWEAMVREVHPEVETGLMGEIEGAVEHLGLRSAAWGRKIPTDDNPAKRLAQALSGKIPIVYGTEGVAEVAAYRWKCQFNECSKSPAWWHSFSELNHNEIVGWGGLSAVTRESLAVIVLRHAGEHPRNARRVDITLPLIEDQISLIEQVRTDVSDQLTALLDLVYFGDFVATYLAIAGGTDPAPVEVIESLKGQLAE